MTYPVLPGGFPQEPGQWTMPRMSQAKAAAVGSPENPYVSGQGGAAHLNPSAATQMTQLSHYNMNSFGMSDDKTYQQDLSITSPALSAAAQSSTTRPSQGQKPQRPSGSNRLAVSRAESTITKVEQLYEAGLDMGIVQEDPNLLRSLSKLKKRFRSLAVDPSTGDSKNSMDSGSEDFSQNSGAD
ncbi:hypothetical protein F5Y16DRAFT_386615 [Xylariaceae sp. FL0255]|nr:hypothetical protein F5Y16DRAFT_386615 [Xylariaceae sp. FL0255]